MSVAADFHELFAGLEHTHGAYRVDASDVRQDGKVGGRAITEKRPVEESHWERHLAGEYGLGIVPIRSDSTVRFGAIDIDVYTGLDHAQITRRLEKLEIPLLVCRSKSGGAHLYLFTSEPVAAKLMRERLHEIAVLLGEGKAEIFPKQNQLAADRGDCGNWINMPYFGGVQGMRYAVDSSGNAYTPEQFVERVRASQRGLPFFTKPLFVPEHLPDGPPCLQHLVQIGFPEGTRNGGLFNLGIYLIRKYPDQWVEQLQEHNQKFFMPPLEPAEVEVIVRSLKQKDYIYTCQKEPIAPFCNSPLCRTRKFGIGALAGSSLPDISNISKLDTRPPTWFLNVGGERLALSTQQLQNPRLFQQAAMDCLNIMPPVPKQAEWQAVIGAALEKLEIIPAPDDGSIQGQFFELVEEFCLRPAGTALSELLLGKTFIDEGRVYFRLVDLMKFLRNRRFTELKQHEVTAVLSERGGQNHAQTVKGRYMRYWSMPAFTGENEPHDVPDSIKGDKPDF